MKFKLARPLLLLCFSFTSILGAQQQQNDDNISFARTTTIHSAILDEDRKLYIYTPSTIPGVVHPAAPYPVLYLLDAEYQMQMVAGLVDYLSKSQRVILPMIIVGLDTNHYDRERDLTPTHSDQADPISKPDTSPTAVTRTSGGGENFLRFLHEEVMPYVQRHYGAAPYSILSGHSLGGLISLHCLLYHPDYFNAYIGISPSIWWDNDYVVRQAAGRLKPDSLKGKSLFFSISSEGGIFYQDIHQFHSILDGQGNRSDLSFRYAYYPDETHGSSPARTEYDALRFLFAGCFPPPGATTPDAILSYYRQFQERFGYAAKADENTLIDIGYRDLEDPSRYEEAIRIFGMATPSYPESSNAFDSLGDAYAKKGDNQKAITAYKTAIELHSADFTEESRTKLKALLQAN